MYLVEEKCATLKGEKKVRKNERKQERKKKWIKKVGGFTSRRLSLTKSKAEHGMNECKHSKGQGERVRE